MKHFVFPFTILLLSICFVTQAKDKHIQLILKGTSYDSLFISSVTMHEKSIKISGTKSDESTWNFILPYSISKDLLNFKIMFHPLNHKYKTMSYIAFKYEQEESLDNRVQSLFADCDSVFIDATFNQQIKYKENIPIIDSISQKKIYAEVEITEDICCVKDSFSIKPKLILENYDLWLRDIDEVEFKKRIEEFSSLIEKYPNSRQLMLLLSMRYSYFRTPKEIEKLYNKFSSDERQSYWGNLIYQQLNNTFFSNSTLKRWDNMQDENIVISETKPTLIIFSASWCRPCRAEIPKIKKLHQDLNENIDFVYVSIDEKDEIKNWQDLMKKEQIKWRSLVAPTNLEYIKTKYLIRGVPEYYLIGTDGQLSVIDLEKEEDIKNLYNIEKI